jgi:protein-tyrosine phosphatase
MRVLMVCTANICRSPMAEGFTRALAPELVVRSAGFLEAGRPAAPDAVRAMAERGVDIAGHRSTVVGRELLAEADLVLTMERAHLRELVQLDPGVRARAYTLPFFVQQAAARPPAADRSAYLRALDDRRGTAGMLGSGPDEVGDPYGRRYKHFRQSADQLEQLVRAFAVAVRAWSNG